MELSDKAVFITGGAQGLGRAYTEAMLERGAKVFFGDVNAETGAETLRELESKFGADRVKFKAFDVTNKADFEAAFKEAISAFGQIDVHINNAGIMNEGLWEVMIQINMTAVVHGTKLATDHMRKDKGGKGGRIINISSVAGLADVFFIAVYCGTKHAVRSYTSCLAQQPNIDAQGVEYGILCPGPVATDLVLKLDASKIDFYQDWHDRLEKSAMPKETVVGALLELLQLKKMNGAMLQINAGKIVYNKMQATEVPCPDVADAPAAESS